MTWANHSEQDKRIYPTSQKAGGRDDTGSFEVSQKNMRVRVMISHSGGGSTTPLGLSLSDC